MPPQATDSRTKARRPARRWTAVALSVLAHVAILGPVLSLRAKFDTPEPPSAPVMVSLEPPPRPEPPPAPPAETADPAPAPAAEAPPTPTAAKPAPKPVAPPPLRLRQPRTPPPSAALPAAELTPEPPGISLLDAGQIAGATTAGPPGGGGSGGPGAGGEGSGAGGGRCDMVRRLQDALSDDAEIRASALAAHRALSANGRALLVWDGDWLQSRGEAGKGLAGLRQAIAVEVAFAPRACKEQTMRGLALIVLPDGPRIALGRGAWRWRDLTGAG